MRFDSGAIENDSIAYGRYFVVVSVIPNSFRLGMNKHSHPAAHLHVEPVPLTEAIEQVSQRMDVKLETM
jgi:hypothetical protein